MPTSVSGISIFVDGSSSTRILRSGPGERGTAAGILVGMQKLPQDELRDALSLIRHDGDIDNETVIRLKKRLAEEFRDQLSVGIPPNRVR